MAYTKHEFQSGEKLYAAQLNEMDEQIAKNEEELVKVSEEMDQLKDGGAEVTETIKKIVNFDSIETGKVYTSSFPNGAALPKYDTYVKYVTPGEVYFITTCVIQNSGYGVAQFFNGSQFVAVAGAYDGSIDYVKDYEVQVPDGATIMYVTPGFAAGEDHVSIVASMFALKTVTFSPNKRKSNARNFVSFDGTRCLVKAKYNDSEDIAFEISKGGGNGLPDIRRIFTINNAGALNESDVASRIILSGEKSDVISPHTVKAVANSDGDTPENAYFTGGNHQTNNAGSGGAVTARNDGMAVMCDNLIVDGSAWGDDVTVRWTNYIQAYNTTKASGNGHEVMKEVVTLTISGTRIAVDVKHYALEDIVRSKYYGLQMVLSEFDSLRYIGGTDRTAHAVSVSSYSGTKSCRAISLATGDGDVLEIGIDSVDLGNFEHDEYTYSAFCAGYMKSYFAVILGKDFAQNSGEMTTLRGYYHIMSK